MRSTSRRRRPSRANRRGRALDGQDAHVLLIGGQAGVGAVEVRALLTCVGVAVAGPEAVHQQADVVAAPVELADVGEGLHVVLLALHATEAPAAGEGQRGRAAAEGDQRQVDAVPACLTSQRGDVHPGVRVPPHDQGGPLAAVAGHHARTVGQGLPVRLVAARRQPREVVTGARRVVSPGSRRPRRDGGGRGDGVCRGGQGREQGGDQRDGEERDEAARARRRARRRSVSHGRGILSCRRASGRSSPETTLSRS